jgi:hypothetical protein
MIIKQTAIGIPVEINGLVFIAQPPRFMNLLPQGYQI